VTLEGVEDPEAGGVLLPAWVVVQATTLDVTAIWISERCLGLNMGASSGVNAG
jgi:hypothetical protein